MVILGIDPGLASTGFGAIACNGPEPRLLRCGYIKTSTADAMSQRLFSIYSDLNHLVKAVRPDLVAVENVFSLVKYPRAGIVLGGVVGIIYLCVVQNNLTMKEITPKEIKNALVGCGSADKSQVKRTVQAALKVDGIKSFHAADALAVALTALYRTSPERVG
ncbi:MAG: crossover junction endodeoxyribonuclease RuvC [Syntrophobacterales bacterium]|jgi:crossover junction endodeoxyribonuclease RuvC|nr:crossover junction endodeoxyribonuclease RuvC [Syntrophobacterales bacterium]